MPGLNPIQTFSLNILVRVGEIQVAWAPFEVSSILKRPPIYTIAAGPSPLLQLHVM